MVMSKFMLWLGFFLLAFGIAWVCIGNIKPGAEWLSVLGGACIGFSSVLLAEQFSKIKTEPTVTTHNSGRDNPYYD